MDYPQICRDSEKKYDDNQRTYKTLSENVDRVYNKIDADHAHEQHPDHTILGVIGGTYHYTTYRIYYNPRQLTPEQLALICDHGDLRYGFRDNGDYIIVNNG